MSTLSVARRYAAALFEVARKAGAEERVGQQLTAFADIVAGHADLKRAIETPAVPATAKKTLVSAIVDAAGDVSPEVKRTLVMLAERDRLILLPEIVASYEGRLLAAKKVVPAEVTTAVPLSADSRAALAAALGKVSGGQVTITEKVDPSIVGGVIARVGGVVYDGSLTHQLERLRERLATQR